MFLLFLDIYQSAAKKGKEKNSKKITPTTTLEKKIISERAVTVTSISENFIVGI
jgi:hypothetical protein